jgi:cytochrome c biogenesis protein CcdA
MKAIVTVLALIGLSFSAFAQFNQQQQSYVLKIGKYNKMKRAGTFMIVAGLAAGVVGVTTMSSALDAYNNNGGQLNDSQFLTGFVLTVCAFPLLGVGIPFTIVGSSASKKYQRKLESLSVHFNMTPLNQGIGLSYKF